MVPRPSAVRWLRLSSLIICWFAIVGVVLTGAAVAQSVCDHHSTQTASPTADGQIVELYPNPTTARNHGEYVTVEIGTAGNWTLTDGHSTARLPDRPGEFAVTRHPAKTAAHTNATLVATERYLRLAVSGDCLELRRDGAVVDSVSYEQAPESHRWHRDREPRWQPDGFRPRQPATVESTPVEAFVLPDSPDTPLAAIQDTDRRLYLAAYTITSERTVDELAAAHDRGVDVQVLVEGGPVGGMSTRQADRLDELSAAGVDVQVMTGERTRFRYQHAKYAVADDRAVVLTENWKPSGTGGRENRGWGLTVDSAKTADELAAIFTHDATWDDTVSWIEYRPTVETTEKGAATGSYSERQPPMTATAEAVTVLTAPDNADEELIRLINETDDRLLIVQPSIGDREFPLLRAAIQAADRGVDVRILLGSRWYNEEENQALAETLRERTEQSDQLQVRLAGDNSRFGKIHAKGIVADDTAVIGSINWNENSVDNNREVALAVEDSEVADYYAEVFDSDWTGGGTDDLPVGIIVIAIGAAGGVVLVLKRRLTFTDRKKA